MYTYDENNAAWWQFVMAHFDTEETIFYRILASSLQPLYLD